MDSSKPVYNNYNRNIGLEYNLASSNNKWTGKAMLLKSFTPGTSTKDWSQAANLQFSSRKWLIAYQHEFVGANYNAEVGYVPRKDYIGFFPFAQRLFFPKKGPVLMFSIRIGTKRISRRSSLTISILGTRACLTSGLLIRSLSCNNLSIQQIPERTAWLPAHITRPIPGDLTTLQNLSSFSHML
jgi:hypothetical protein